MNKYILFSFTLLFSFSAQAMSSSDEAPDPELTEVAEEQPSSSNSLIEAAQQEKIELEELIKPSSDEASSSSENEDNDDNLISSDQSLTEEAIKTAQAYTKARMQALLLCEHEYITDHSQLIQEVKCIERIPDYEALSLVKKVNPCINPEDRKRWLKIQKLALQVKRYKKAIENMKSVIHMTLQFRYKEIEQESTNE